MGRLIIDADDVIALLANHHFDKDKGNLDLLIHNLCKEVRRIPTAYDVDAVVRQLEEYHEEMEQFKCGGMLSDMIEVVKAGGIVKENELSKDDADLER